jgi:hypothetical protein
MNVQEDLRERWLPSAEQMRAAEAVLATGDCPDGTTFTCHLLINKHWGWWTPDVEIVHLDGVFSDRCRMQEYLLDQGSRHYDAHGKSLTGGYSVHFGPGEAAVFEDIMCQFPED